jgi:hypothetical protein
MRWPVASLVCCCAAAGVADTARAQAPVAIVEEIQSKTAGIEFMDYLATGQVIRLGASDRLIISYLKSCWREVISGGTVVVGQEDSDVANGTVERRKVPCDAGNKGSTTKETTGSGAMVFRKLSDAQPRHIVYALSPIFVASSGGDLVIERLDKKEASITLEVPPSPTARGGIVDLAKSNVVLSAGGLYRAKSGGIEITFKVDSAAQGGRLPIVSRLLQLPSPR